jgi:hypothetical protein
MKIADSDIYATQKNRKWPHAESHPTSTSLP